MSKLKRKRRVERYQLERSPFAQNPTQRELASLLGVKRDELRALATNREAWIIRRDEVINGKLRHLAYPRGKLRRVHELLKFHLNKIKQPDYLYSPRNKRSQRDNAARHLGQQQFLTLDVKQFYPSTTEKHVYRWAKDELGMYDDVAGLLTAIATIDGIVSFGSPATPVLATLVHRHMFDSIANVCQRRGLRISLWVDDITISGKFVPGTLVSEIREIIRRHGLKSHKLQYRTGNRPVSITGINVQKDKVQAPRRAHDQIRKYYEALSAARNDAEAEIIINRLLSVLGTMRYTVGKATEQGSKVSNRMNTLRQKRARLAPLTVTTPAATTSLPSLGRGEIPW